MSGARQWTLVGGIVVVTAVAVVIATKYFGGALAQVEAGSKAPDFRAVPVALSSAHGAATAGPKSIANYKGQVVVLNIWATWCTPCRAEMPSLERLQQEMGAQGLKIVAVSIDNPGMEQAIRDFAKELGLDFEILYDATGRIRDDYQSTGVPETFVIGKDGVIRKRVIAATDWDTESQKALFRQLLAEPTQ
jgi:thiol-disulfide isomerase/thioredoxin